MKAIIRTCFFVSLTTILACSTFRSRGHFQAGNDAHDGPSTTAQGTPTLQFDWPVDEARLTQRYLPHKKRRPHWGIDLASNRGSHIMSSHYGTVVYTGSNFKGYGKLIVVESGPIWATFYSHLDKILVKEGQVVKPGQIIGLMGRTGRATGVHLHFEVRNNRMPIDPLRYLPGGEQI